MIEVTIDDVIVRALKGGEAKWPAGRQEHKLGWERAVLLKERAGERILPIWVGPVEGDLLAMYLVDISTPRPMPYDLMARLLDVGEISVEKIAVTTLRDNTFYATIWVGVGDRLHEVDARPSDALNLALRAKAPIFVAPEVFEQSRVLLTPDGVLTGLEDVCRKDMEEKGLPPEAPEMEYRSFRSLPRGDGGGWLKPAAKWLVSVKH